MRRLDAATLEPAQDEILALIATLQHAEQRLEELTGGEVDTVAGASGRPFLLRRAQEELRSSEASKQAAILNALPAHVALLDTDGIIVSVNETWRQFAAANALPDHLCGIGVNYLEVCDRAEGMAAVEAPAAAAGIRSVLDGARSFSLEYPCHSPTTARWFQMTATPMGDSRARGVVVMHLDVTARREAEESSRASGHRLRSLIDGLGSSRFVGLLSPQGRVIEISRSALTVAGVAPEDVVGKAFDETVWWSGLPRARRRVRGAITRAARGQASRFDVKTRGAGSQLIDVDFSMHPLRDETGAVAFLVPSAIVITERKEAEAALRRSEREFRTLAESMPQIVWVTGRDGQTTYLNQQWMVYTGLTMKESLGEGWIAGFHPEDRQRATDAWQRAMKTRGIFSIESRLRRRDGTYRWWLMRGVPHGDADDRIGKWFGTCTDIHDLKLAELEVVRSNRALQRQQDELRVLFDIIPAMIWLEDADGRIVRVNQRAADFAGRSIEEIEGRLTAAIQPNEAAASHLDALQVIASGEAELDRVESVPGPGGEPVWVRTDKVPVRGEDGRITGVVVMAQDVTERKAMEAQLRHSQKMEALGTLAGGIAHDFNNILCGITGYTAMTQSRVADDPDAAEYLGSVMHGAQRAAALVRHILAFSRQEELILCPAQLGPLVAEPLDLMRATLPATIAFDVAIESNLPAVMADATQVHQVVMNLCTNAWQAMQGHSGRLVVRLAHVVVDELLARTEADLHPGAYVRLEVTDTGHGMDEATRSRIFEPFFTTKAPGHGTGLGLPTVHGIMKRHRGAVSVRSRPDEGTTFHAYFPAVVAEPATIAGSLPIVPRGAGESVLFVDDDTALTRLGQAMLEELGYVVTVISRPLEALEAVRAAPMRFALVVSDVTMPVMTGPDLAAHLRAIRPDLPIILTTGFAENVPAESLEAAGIRAMLLKPYSLSSLATAVSDSLRKVPVA